MSELPKGWISMALGEIAARTSGVDPLKSPGETFELYSVPSFFSGQPEIVLAEDIGSLKQALEPNDILLCKIVPHINRVWSVAPKGAHRQIGSGEWIVYRGHECEPMYLRYCLTEQSFREKFLATSSGLGGSLTRARPSAVAEIKIPLPPLPEQRRIAANVGALIAHTTRARIELARIRPLIARYRQRLLALAFSGSLTAGWRAMSDVGPNWRNAPLAELASVGTGATPKRGTPAYYDGGTIPWVTSAAVNSDLVSAAGQTITEMALRETNCKIFPTGTLIVAMYGEGQTRGKVAVLGIDAATNQALAAIQVQSNDITSEFLFWFFKSNYLQLREQAVGGVQPNLSLAIVKRLMIPLPTLAEQGEIVRRIETAFGWIDRLTTDHAAAERLLPCLDARILSKAIHGKLTPQDPNDEPAFVLLDRIRAGRAEASTKRSARPRVPPAKPRAPHETSTGVNIVSRNRHDPSVSGQPYLAALLRKKSGSSLPESLFAVADLELIDFYKQLSDEFDHGWIVGDDGWVKAA